MRQRRKHKLSWYIIWLIIISASSSFLLSFILSLPVWKISGAYVEGNSYISQEKIMSLAAIPVGENILFIDAKKIEGRIKSLIQIRSVKVSKRFPDHLMIDIRVREPFALVSIDRRTVLIDSDGYIIATPGEKSFIRLADVSRLPVVRGVKASSLIDGKRLNFSDRMFITQSLGLLTKFINPESLQIQIGNISNIVLYIEDVLKIELGDPGDLDKKIAAIRVLLREVEGKWDKVDYINVKVPDSPVVRYKP